MKNLVEMPRAHVIHDIVRQTGAARLALVTDAMEHGQKRLPLLPSVTTSEHMDVTLFSRDGIARLEKYADILEPALGMRHVIVGDGPTAQFKDFQLLPAEKGENPYRTARRSIQATFQRGWNRFESYMKKGHPELLDEIRERYKFLLGNDPTSHYTGNLIDHEMFRIGVELATSAAYFALGVGLAIDNSMSTIPALRSTTPLQRYEIGITSSRLIRARATDNLRLTFWSKTRDNPFVDWDSLRLIERPDGTYNLNQRGGKFRPYDPEKDPLLAEPTIGCMALHFTINDGDRYTALDNARFAAIRVAGEQNLFNPAMARRAWEQRRHILERPEIADIYKTLPEDLSSLRKTPPLNTILETLENEFI